MKDQEYRIHHFSLNLPIDGKQDNVPELLRHLAHKIEKYGQPMDIQDIVFRVDDHDETIVPTFTVYYTKQ